MVEEEEYEILHFRIGLSGTSAKKQPKFKILVNGKEHISASLTAPVGEVELFDFNARLVTGDHQLEIVLLNKLPQDTVVAEDGSVTEDLMLNIQSIEIDEIDLEGLKWKLSSYYPIYPASYLDEEQKKITEVKNCVNLGWNGSWKLPFTTPFYMWLLENL